MLDLATGKPYSTENLMAFALGVFRRKSLI